MSIGIKVGGRNINNLRYADDTTLLAVNEGDLRRLITKVKEQSRKAGLSLNIKKTKLMSSGPLENFKLGEDNIEVVHSFVILGEKIEKDGSCSAEMGRRIVLGKTAMSRLNKIIKDRDVSKTTKMRMISPLVFPVMLYGRECWTVTKAERKKVDSSKCGVGAEC